MALQLDFKFQIVINLIVHTLSELKLTGNGLKGSRPILSFDDAFDSQPHYKLLKELFVGCFGTPKQSRRIKPFVDRVMSFSIVDGRVWIRNYQIVPTPPSDKKSDKSKPETSLVEMGPRMVLQIIRIFENSFHGSTLFENEFYVSPNNQRRLELGKTVIKHKKRNVDRMEKSLKEEMLRLEKDPLNEVFE